MSRSEYIYLLRAASGEVLAACTVKHELKTLIGHMWPGDRARTTVTRYRDGHALSAVPLGTAEEVWSAAN